MPPRRSLFEMVFGVEQPPASPRKRKKTEVGALLSDQGFSETAINKHLEAEKVMDPMPKKRRKTEVEMLLRGQSLSEHAIGEYMRQARVPVASTSRSNGKNASGARKKKKKKKKKRMLVDKEPFPFLSLPAELRNKIYKLVIGGHVIRVFVHHIHHVHNHNLLHTSPWFHDQYETWDTYVPSFDLEEVSPAPEDKKLRWGSDGLPTNWSKVHPQGVSRIYSLSLVCRQMTQETRLFALSTNIFFFFNGVQHALDAAVSGWTHGQCAAITEVAVGRPSKMDSLAPADYAHYLHTTPLRTVFPALNRVYISPHPSWTAEQALMFMEELAAKMLAQGKGEDEGVELVLMDPRDISVSYHDEGTIKVEV